MRFAVFFMVFLFISVNCYAQDKDEYGFIQGAYVTNIAEDLHDDGGSVYISDPDDQATLLGFGYGRVVDQAPKNYRLSTEFEISYIFGANIKILEGGHVKPSTKATFANLMYDKYISDKIFLKAGGGIGFSRTTVDTDYNDGSTTFSGSYENELKLSYHYSAGIGYELTEKTMIDLTYRYANFGDVRGASGAANTGATYNADKFDNVMQAYMLTIRFKM